MLWILLDLILRLFFFNAPATTKIYTLSLHDALPISVPGANPPGARRARPVPRREPSSRPRGPHGPRGRRPRAPRDRGTGRRDRKSTRLNSSHSQISYAVFCLKKKNCTSNKRLPRFKL